jgi:hypothetical protein
MWLRTIIAGLRWLPLGVGLLLTATPLRAQAPPTQYQLKAAFLYNFAKFIDWPPETFPDDKSPFIIGILGENPFGTDLERMVAEKKINNRPIKIRPFSAVADATNCCILFISTSEIKRMPEIMEKLHGTSVLTVGETDQFIGAGGMINFVPEANKIRFQINDAAAKAAGLKISSKLLSLAVHPAS